MVQRKRGRSSKSQRLSVQRPSSSLRQPNVWVVLSVALLVIGLTVITSLGPSSVTGNTVQNIGRMNKGDSLQLAVRDVPGLETVFTNAGETIKYGTITVEADESIPFDRLYISKFKVSSPNKFGALQLRFKVREQDLLDKGISRGDLRLYHGLKEYPLQLLKVNYGNLYYIVTVPSMGSFVLGRVATVENGVQKEVVAKVIPEQIQQPAAQPVEKVLPEETPLVGRAAELPAEETGTGFFARIAQFFRNLFS